MKKEVGTQSWVKKKIAECEGKHIQQIAYSSFHDALTQVCFSCGKVRTNLPLDYTLEVKK